jgi:16S rRNA processing protein RimM
MIDKNKCTLLGTLLKPHGIKGAFLLKLAGLEAEDIKKKGPLFVEIDGLLVPFFLEDIQAKTADSAIVTLEGIITETRAREFTGDAVYIGKEQIVKKKARVAVQQSIKGYRVIDSQHGFVGEASEIIEITNNPLLSVKNLEREFLIPVHEDIVLAIDDDKKIIRINAPDGLLAL